MAALPNELTIGELSARSGVAPSALRFYEARGLIASRRTAGNQRRYERAMLRRVAAIRASQRLGLSLDEVAAAFRSLPGGRTPTREDWTRLSRSWRATIDERVAELQRLRDDLTGCIGCGCLSLRSCKLFNRDDVAAAKGSGARVLLGDVLEPLPPADTDAVRARGY